MKRFKDLSILSFLFFLLLPRFFEVTAETWKVWKAAVILRDTGYFSMFSMGPLYDLYLMPFTFLTFPYSINLEFIITHLFAFYCLKKLLRKYLPEWICWILVAAWIPNLCILESTKYVAGIAFICWHFSLEKNSNWRRSFFPPILIASILCSQGNIIFYIGHLIGLVLSKVLRKENFEQITTKVSWLRLTQLALLALIIVANLRQSPRRDNNPFMNDSAYFPVPTQSHMTIAFFQMGNFQYVSEHYPENKWKEMDWFETNKEAFAGAQSIVEAIRLRPRQVLNGIIKNAVILKRVPIFFFIGDYAFKLKSSYNFAIKVLIFSLIGFTMFYNIKKTWQDPKHLEVLLPVVLGLSSLIMAILLTWVNFRFFMQLLPGFIVFIAEGLTGENPFNERFLQKKWLRIFLFGTCSVIFLLSFFPSLVFSEANWLTSLNFILLALLLILTLIGDKFTKIKKLAGSVAMVGSALTIIFSFSWPMGVQSQITQILNLKTFLNLSSPVSYSAAYDLLKPYVDKSTKHLSNEANLFEGPYDLGINKALMSTALPPKSRPKDEAQKILSEIDLIIISKNWAVDSYSVGTQDLYKYQIHVKPFLEEQIKLGQWRCDEIDYYGEACVKL